MEYIADGYDVEALHYLIKPVTKEKLTAILDRAVEKLVRNESALFIKHAGESVRIPFYEIRYFEVLHNYVTIHADDEYKVKGTLSELEKELDDSFFRAGRSFIVNLRYVRKSTKSEIHLTDGSVIPLSRGLYQALNRVLIDRL
jgi:DNA-binding LytR/AlgR family response regulator